MFLSKWMRGGFRFPGILEAIEFTCIDKVEFALINIR